MAERIGRWEDTERLPDGVTRSGDRDGIEARARKALLAFSAKKILLVDIAGDRAPGREKDALRLHASLVPLLRRRKIRSIWIVSGSRLSPGTIGAMKERASWFVDCSVAGKRAYAQCIPSPGGYTPGQLLPRAIDLNDPDIALGPPALPGLAPAPGNREDAPPAVVDLLQEPFRDAFRLSPEPAVLFSLGGGTPEPNAEAGALLGYGREDLALLTLRQIVAPPSYRAALRALAALRRRRKAAGQIELVKKNGRPLPVSFSAVQLGSSRCMLVMRDASADKKRAEEAAREIVRLTSLAAGSPIPHALVAARKLVRANDAFRTAFPWIDVSTGEVTLREFLGKENIPLARDLTRADGESPAAVRGDVVIRTPEGDRREFALIALRTSWDDGPAWYLTLEDVTAKNAALRSLHESERTFRELCERQAGPVSVLRNGTIVFANQACAALLGVPSPADLNGKELSALVAPRDRKAVAAALAQEGKQSETFSPLEYSLKGTEGEVRRIVAHGTRVQFSGEDALLLDHVDVTARVRAEEELRRQSRAEAVLGHLAHDIHLSLDPQEVLQRLLRGSMKWLGFDAGGAYRAGKDGVTLTLGIVESLAPRIAEKLAVQDTREGVTGLVWKTAEPLLLDVQEYPAHIPFKSLFESEGVRTVLYLPLVGGETVNAVLLLCSAQEATPAAADPVLRGAIARHGGDAMGNALRYEMIASSERAYRGTVESMTDAVYECAPNGTFLYVSPRVEKLSGYTPEEVTRTPDFWRNLLHPDERTEYSRRISNQAAGTDEFDLEYRILPKGKASYRWVRDAVRYRRDSSGAVAGITGVLSDVTSRVEAARAEASGGVFREAVLQSIQEGVLVLDRDLRYRVWNRGMELITGIAREDIVGRNAFEDAARFQAADFPELLNRALAGDPVSTEDVRYTRPGSGESIVLWCRFSPLREASGSITGVVGTVADVTHRKSLERELRESEETLRNVIDTMGDALMISDLQGKVWEVNREFTALTGHARSEVIGMTFPYPWLIEEEMSRLVVWLAALREKRYLRDFDMTWKRHDGSEVAISLNTTLLRNASGEPVAMLNIARDISERKGLANDLFAKSRQIEMLNRIISTANSSTEFTRIFDVIATEVRTLTSFDHMSVCLLPAGGQTLVVHATVGAENRFPPVGTAVPLQQTVARLAVAEGRGVVVKDVAAHPSLGSDLLSARAGMRSEISIPILLNERILGTFSIASEKENAFGLTELAFLQPIADQIGALLDRTMLFQRVMVDSAYIHDLLDSIDSVVFTVDRGSVVREVNKAWREFAVLQGTPELVAEDAVIGKPLREIIPSTPLREALVGAAGRLFDGSLKEYLHEFTIGTGETGRVFQIAVTPLEMHDRVSGLVFTYTDITDSKRTEAEIKRRNEELLALNAIASSINRSLNPDEVLGVAAQQVRQLVQADIVLCYLPDEGGEHITLAAHLGISDRHARTIASLPVEGSATGTVITERKPIIIMSGLPGDARVSAQGRGVFSELGTNSLFGIPLESKEKVLGALLVAFTAPHTFTDQEQRFITLVGNQLASALENAQLYSELQAHVRRVTLQYEIGKSLTGALDTRSIITVVHDGLQKALAFDAFAYFSRSPKSGALELQLERAGKEGSAPALSAALPGVIAAMSGTPFAGNSGTGALLAVPVHSKEVCVGVIALARETPGSFGEAHLRLVESIANLTEIAIDRAGLYEDTVAKSQEIEARNKELDDFTYVVSHDLKEPLIAIDGYSKIVLNDYRDRIDEEGKGYLNSIVQSGNRMKNLIDDLLTLSRLGRVLETEESLPLAEVVQDVLRDFEFTLRESHATVNVPPDLPTVRYNRIQLGMVFRNLIANAIKFNRSPAPRVDIRVDRGEGLSTVSVRDNGVGIDRQHYDKIFVIFQRLQRSEDFRGTGAGLTIVKKIVENHGGKIWVDSVVGAGTTFYFTIPD